MMYRVPLLAAALAGCSAAAAAPPAFDPFAFFTGTSRGEGTLKMLAKPRVPLRVESHGRSDGNGGLILDQTIHQGDKPARQRRWVLHPTSATTVSGTISGNPGMVSGRLDGNRLVLRYAMKDGLKVRQVLTIRPDGRSVVNRVTVRKLGLAVAHVDEVITKVD
jgi:hypothetical protein